MKNKVYIERYADRLIKGDTKKALVELTECFINEYNSEVLRRKIRTPEQGRTLAADINRKGNELAEMIQARTGVKVFKPDWFMNVYLMIAEDKGDEK